MTTEQKHEIEIPGLPEGWRAVAYRRPVFGEYYFYNDDIQQGKTGSGQFLIVEKIKPRRIVLEETEEDNYSSSSVGPLSSGSQLNVQSLGDGLLLFGAPKIWRVINTFSEEE